MLDGPRGAVLVIQTDEHRRARDCDDGVDGVRVSLLVVAFPAMSENESSASHKPREKKKTRWRGEEEHEEKFFFLDAERSRQNKFPLGQRKANRREANVCGAAWHMKNWHR